MSALLISMPLAVCAVVAQPMPVILDTDLGDDIDDTWALGMLLGSPQVDMKLIVTAADDTVRKTRLVAKILEAMGRTDIPLGRGIQQSSDPIHQEAWLGDYHLDAYPGTLYGDGIQAMIDTIHASKVPVTLLVIGPQTNIQEALRRDPTIARKARVVSMEGSVDIGYGGSPKPSAEWNVFKDIPAAKAVFDAPWDITIAPLDSTGTLRLTGEHYAAVEASEHPRARTVIENYRQWANPHQQNESSSILFDTVAAYLVFDSALCEMETAKLSIDDEGKTVRDENGRPVHCAMGWKDLDAFKDLLVASLTTDP
ncbi:MAG: hypothetical protein GWP08_17005 [Nitrospiraceae bacterium]|nr:hypothetical protein [Nitrospiraceae bacterium]